MSVSADFASARIDINQSLNVVSRVIETLLFWFVVNVLMHSLIFVYAIHVNTFNFFGMRKKEFSILLM